MKTRFHWFPYAALGIAVALILSAPASALPGDLLATVNLPVPSTNGVSVGGTFDGTNYLYIDEGFGGGSTVHIVTPPPGNGFAVLVASKPIVDGGGNNLFITAITFDSSRSKLWGATGNKLPQEIYLIDTSGVNAVGTLQFTHGLGGIARTDGIAWDNNDDTLYFSPDVDNNVYQYSLGTGVNPPLGTLMNTVTPEDAGGNQDGDVSGVAIGSANTLYIGRNGHAEIRQVNKTTGAFVSTFATPSGRVEDLVCDPVTYAPLEAILSKDAFNDLYEAFEVVTGTCPLIEECDPDPRTQGFYHRQCMGLGLILPGRNGRGPQEPNDPDFEKIISDIDARLEETLFNQLQTCQDGLDANPPSDPCQRALKQYTALLANIESGRLQESCEIDLSAESCSSTNIGDLVGELASLITSGDPDDCKKAAACAGAINEGGGITNAVFSPLTADADPGDSGSGGEVPASTPVVAESVVQPIPATAGRTAATALTDTAVVEPSASTVLAPIVFVEEQGAGTPEASDSVPTQEPDADIRKSLERHFAVLVDSTAAEESRKDAEDTLLTALGGGYEPKVRLRIIGGLVGNVDESYNSLLAKHLEDIRNEAKEFGKDDLVSEAERLLKKLEPSKE